jgi:hypothetical protein
MFSLILPWGQDGNERILDIKFHPGHSPCFGTLPVGYLKPDGYDKFKEIVTGEFYHE